MTETISIDFSNTSMIKLVVEAPPKVSDLLLLCFYSQQRTASTRNAWTTGVEQNHFTQFGHRLPCFAPVISCKLGNIFQLKYILQVFIYFYEFKNTPVILEVGYKEGNGNEWPWVQQFTVLWKQDKNKIRMSDFSRPNSDKSNRKRTGKVEKWWQFLLK